MSSFEHAVIAYALYRSVEKGFMHFPVPAMEGDEGLFQSPESVAQPQILILFLYPGSLKPKP